MDLDKQAEAAFLAEPHVGILAVTSVSGPPAAVPLWYSYSVGGELWILTEATSRKLRLLKRTRCATLVVDEVDPRTRYVSVDCAVVDVRPATAQDVRKLASRYLSGGPLEEYLAFAAANIPDEQRVTLQPTRWRFADLTL